MYHWCTKVIYVMLEKIMIYKIFSMLDTAKFVNGRTFTNKTVSDLKSKLTTKLKDSELEKNTKDYKDDTCFKLLSSVAQIFW